jgi:hypothetical protein
MAKGSGLAVKCTDQGTSRCERCGRDGEEYRHVEKFQLLLLQLREGVDLRHVKMVVALTVDSVKEKGLITLLWSKPLQTLIFAESRHAGSILWDSQFPI